MKSALANIGETELSLEAEKLEHAGRTENVNFILSQLPHFLTALREVIEQLKPAEDEDINEAEDDIQDSDRAFLHEKLHIIHGACTFFDKKNAKEALAELKEKKWSKPIRDKLARIAEHLLHSEFEEAAVLAKDISSL
jgi:HPt (histidine-containing phosphotransfer) domain-containing protein